MINEIEDKNNRRNLYEALKGDFDLGTAEQFEKSMQSAEARKNLWNAIHEDYDVGTFEQFEKDMMGDKVKPEQANHSQPTNAQPNQPQPQQPQQAQFQQSLPITSKVGQTEQGNKQIAQVHNQQSSSQAMPPQATMNAPQPRQQVMSLNDRQKLWTWRNIKPTLSTGQTEQQYNARWNNEVENVKRRNDPDEIAAFNAFQKELAQQQAKVQQQGHAIVETGNQPFQSESGTEVWPISFSRKTIPHNQDYVFTLRVMQQAKGTYDLQYNIKDPEIRRDYEALTAPTDDTYRPTDAILDASPREKNKYYQWYAAYLYSNGGEMPEWLDYTAQLKLRSLNKSNLESEAKQWTNLVERTRNARKFRGSNSVSDWLNEQYNFKSGAPRIINGASYPYLVTRAGLIQTPLVQTTGRATVADNRRAYNELLQSNEQSKANPAQGDVYSTSNIINPERFWANTTKWQDLSESQKAAYKDEADYYNQMLKGQANVGYYNVGNGQNEEVEFLKHNRKQMNEQYNMLTDKERTQAVMKQAERTLNVLNGISHNLNTKLRFSIMGKGVEEDNGIRSVIRRYEKFLEVAPRYLKKRNYSAALQFWNGLTDLNGLTFGLLGVADAVSLNKIANNPPKDLIEKFGGEANAKKVIATAIQLDNMAEEYRQKLDYYGTGYSLGGLTQFSIQAGLPLFKGTEAVGKILTGGMRGLVKKATLRYMPNTAKRLGAKELVQTTLAEGTRQAMREDGIGGAAGYVAGRLGVANGVSTIVGKAAQGSVEGVVLSVPHAIANVTNNRTGQANVVEINREGIKVNDQPFTHMNQAPDGKVEADTMLREWSQWVGMRVGEVFMPFSKYVDGKVANVAKGAWNKSVGRFIDGSSFARITETFSKAANVGKAATEVGKYVSGNLKRAGMGGTLTFYAQTNLSEMLNAMTVGDVSWDDIKSDQLDKLWGAFVSNAYLVAQNNLVGTVGYYNQKSNLNKSLAQYDAQGSAAWGETDWNGIKADVDRLIDNDKNLQAYQNGVLANENLSKPQRETISQYIATRKTLQAFDLFAKVGNEKSKPNEFDIRYNDAYIAGTQVKSPDQMAQMRESLDASRNTLSNLLGIKPEQVDALFADTNKSLGQIYEELTQQFVDNEKANLPNGQSVNTTNIEPIKRAIDHYCTALSMQRGVSESLITSQLEAVQKLDAKVDAATNKDSGMIERATDDMGRECYVISGNADSSNNTDMVVVRYTEDGRVASLSPKQVTIIQQTDAHELKQKNADLVDLNYEGILNSIVNGKTLPEPNDQVVLYDGKSRGVATIEGFKYEESTKDDTRGVAAQPKSVVVKTEDGRIIELPIDTYRQWVRDGFKHDTEVYVHGTESDNSENANKPTEGTENATEAPTLAEGLRVSINGNEYTIGKVDDSRVELIDENGKDFHWTRSALDKKLKSGDAEILASNEENAQQKPELHYGDEVELNDPDNGENIRGKVNSRDASDEVEIVTDDGRVLRYSKRELDNVIQNVYNNGEHIWSKDENKTEEASNETDTEQEPQPIGKGMFGNIYNQFKGKAKEAINFLKKLGSGEAVAALHHKEVGDISLVWGNDKAGLKKILRKHPEVVDNLQGILDGMHVVQSSENRIILESDTHKAVVSREFDGTPREQWLLTAYEKKNASGGSIDIVPEPTEGKQNGTAPLQDILSADKVTEQSATSQAEAPQNEPMPMHTVGKGKNAVQTEDWLATTPKRGFDYIFGGESGLDADEGREFVNNKLAEAQKNLDKVKNGKPKMGTSIAAYKEAKEAYTTRVEDAQKAVDYWQSVKAEHDKVLLAERHARDEKDKALHEQAVAEEQQRMQDDARKATEQAELGSNAVAPTIRDKWNAAKKENGDADEITLPNGEVVKGHYVLTESGAASASHQATNGFAETEGFPIDENGQSVNDRDYKRDQEAQQVTRSMATDYDQRALQSPVVVSQEGVVLSGNGRTMAGELAAQDGTDTKYVDYLHSHANKFGFTPEQVNGFKHPRVVFVPNEAMPYNADTFAKFNQREQKSQNNTEMAVKMGKVVNDALFGRIMDMVSKYDTLGEFYADDNATYAVVKQLAEADIIPQTEMAHLFDGGKLSEAGQSMIEGVMIGKVFQANPDAVRQITEVKSMRQAVMTALQDIVQNNRLGGGYNLSNELAEAVNLVYRARKAGYKLGQHVSYFAHQGNLFEYDEGATVADFNNMAVMMLADVLNDGRSTQLKKVIAFYNEQATDAAQGIGDMFVGGVKSKTEIINEVNKALNNGREYNTTATSLADGQGQRNQSSKQSNDVGTSGTDGKPTNDTSAVTAETDVESGATEGEKSSATGDVVPSGEGDSPLSEKIATASAEVNTEPTEAQKEAGNYKKGHVKVGTFDITIEQPQGSVRKGTDADGKQWESKMNNTYGYIRGAVGVDGDHIDVFLSNDIDGWNGRKVFVVDQYNPDGSFDEHKVMLGFNDADEAKSDYLANYEKGWEDGRRIDVTAVNLEDFEKWIESSKRKTKPFGEYSSVKKDVVERNEALEYEKALDHLEELEQKWEDKIQDYVYEHYPTQATISAESTSEKGLQERKAMKADPVLKQMYAEAKKEIDAADEMVTQKYSALPEDLRQQKAGGKSVQPPTREETILRDSVIDHMKGSGLDVLGTEEGQQVLDMANGRDVRLSAKQKRALETVTMADKSTNKATAISSAAGAKGTATIADDSTNKATGIPNVYAKVQTNLENLARVYAEKATNKTRGFITDLSRALNLTQHEASNYGTFALPNGKTLAIRISNHNALVSNFDKNNENNGISIVISSHRNKRLNNDGKAHIVEYFYHRRAIENATGKPLAEILKSIKDAINSGEFKDTTGLAEREEVNEYIIREQRVYHGSGADFGHFDHSHMGEGEGAQAFGWGTYVTEVDGIGRTYAESARKKPTYLYGGKEMSSDEFHDYVLGEIGDWNGNMLNDFMYNLERHGVTRAKDILKKGDLARYKNLFYQSLGDTRNYAEGKIKAARTLLSLKGIRIRKPKRHLYTIEIPDDNGKNYLDWNGHPAESLLKDVGSFLESNGFEMVQDSPARYEKGESTIVLNPNATGTDLYAEMQEALGSDKEASKALSEIGLTGIKYPADYMRGGREDGAKNYVIFNENDAKITDHVRFFKTKNGEAYGFTIGGKIYIDPKVATSETPVHEYAHLWATALKANNAKEWQNVVGLMKGTSVWEEVKKLYPELKSDDEIADEVLATYSGRRGAERLRKEMDDIAKSNGNVFDKATSMNAMHRVKQAIEKFWKAVADFLHIHYTSAEQVADQVMKDLLNGVDPRSMMDGGKSLRPETRINIVAAKAVADEMHLGGNVDVLTSTDGLTGRKKNAKGWYDPQTGRITIVLPNHNGRADVVNTMLHEAVGHYGLRELVGKEKMNEFLDFVFKNADKATRSQIAHNSAKYGWDMRKATEEYMASMAEDGTFKNVNKRWWHQLKLAFLKMLHKLGFAGFSGTTLSDNDLRYLLWRSWKNLAEGPARNIYQVAEDTWRQQHLKVGDFAEPKAVDAKTREQNLYYREERERKSARDEYERSVNTAKHKMNLAWVDSMSGLKLLQDAIVPNEKDLKDWENAYMAENRMSSTNLAEMETYKKSFYKDLLDAEQELLDKGAIHEQVTNYMMAKHGLERNEVLAFRDALKHDFANDKQKMSAAWKAYKNDATAQQNKTDFESGKISWDDYKANDTAIREKYAPSYKKYRSKDYSGLTELTTDDPSIKSYQDQIATLKEQLNNERDDATKKSIRIKIAKLNKEMVNEAERIAENSSSNFEKKYDTSELWNRTNAATKASLTKQYESGLLTDEVYHHTLDMFKNYIPLRGFDDVTSDEVYNYFGNAKGQFGGGIRSAKGRKSKADDPIATIGNMAESAIMQGNRNQMKQHFLKMVLNHPSDAVSVDQLYLHYDAATQEWKPVFAEFEEHDDANAVAQKVEAFNQRMETLCQQKPDEYKKASEAHDIQYKVVGKNINEHQVHVKMQGKDYVLTINGNPEAAQALNGQTNPDSTDNPFIKFFQSTNHFMAAMFTQKNPAFILSNLSRDSFYANSMVWAKESPAYAWKFNKNWGKSLYTLFGLITRQRKGTLNMNDKVDRMYQEFIENGGETGYTFLHSVDDYKNMIAKALKESRRSGWNPKSWLKFLDNLINYLGTWAENTSRFAAYKTSREMGRSIEKSIWDAKEISVNFNKKGAGAKAAGKWEDGNRLNVMQAYMSQSAKELYVFWNAGVQGLSNVSRTFGKSKGKTLAVAGLYFAIGTALPMLMAALSQGSGDDDTNYYDLPDWVRRNNLCFYTGKGWVTIPLPIELRAFYGLGELAQSVLSGNEEYTATDIATKMLEQVSQLFPVDFMEGGGSLTSFVPSYAKPIVEAYVTNKDYTGTPIYKDAEYNKNRPEWTKAYKGTNQALVWASRLLNELGGGDDVKKANVGVMDVNPAKIQHLFEGYFGGLGKFVFQTMKVASMPFNEDNRELKNVPIINSFYKTSDERTKDRAITSKFYKYNDEYQKTKELLSLYKKELQAPEYKSKFYDLMYSPEGFSATMMDSYNKQLSAVRKAMSVTDPNSDKYKKLQQQQVDIQKQAVKVIEATKGVVNSEDKEMKELYNLWMQDYSNDPKKAEERSNKTIEMRKDIVKRIMDIAKQNKPQKK